MEHSSTRPGVPQTPLETAQQELRDAIAASGGYVVDPQRAEEGIRELTRIAGDVKLAARQPLQFRVEPPGWDLVSINAANNANILNQRAHDYCQSWAQQIEATRDALRRQLDAYNAVERENARRRA